MNVKPTAYPDHNIDPRKKDSEWVMSYIRAAYMDFVRHGGRGFSNGREEYAVIRQYALGRQSISKYFPLLDIGENSSDTWLNIDWSILPIVKKYRRIALKKLNKAQYRIVCTAIDQMSQDIRDRYFKEQRAKIIARRNWEENFQDQPMPDFLKPRKNDPLDERQLEMKMRWGFKHNHAIDMEKGVRAVFNQNKVDQKIRSVVRESLWDFGVAFVKDSVDHKGGIKIRNVKIENMLISRCTERDFSDAVHIGEVIEMTLGELRQMAGNEISSDGYLEIAKLYQGKFSNDGRITFGSSYVADYDKFKVRVVDLEFMSQDISKYEERVNKYGNTVFGRTGYDTQPEPGKRKVHSKTKNTIYGGMWIVDSPYCFSAGRVYDPKLDDLGQPKFSYVGEALEMENMLPAGKTKDTIPSSDALQIAWYKLQNTIAEARPKGILIELGGLENITLGGGGEKMKPLEVLDLFNKKGILVYRKIDIQGRPTNYRPIEELNNGIGEEAKHWFEIIQNHIQIVRDITGMNEMTDGSTPDARTLTTIAQLAEGASNNSLGDIIEAERSIYERLAESAYCRLQHVLKYKEYTGYAEVLGSTTVESIRLNADLTNWKYAVIVQEKATNEEKDALIGQLLQLEAKNMLAPQDVVMIKNMDNLKEAEQLLGFILEEREREARARAKEDILLNGKVQQDSAKVAEEQKRLTFDKELEITKGKYQAEGDKEIRVLKAKYDLEAGLGITKEAAKSTFGAPQAAGLPEQQGPVAEEMPSMAV